MAMFENIGVFFKRFMQNDKKELLADNPTNTQSKDAAKERLHVVLMQDRANVSADFLELMKEEILEVIKKYIVIDESKIDVRLTNQENDDGSMGAPLLHANIPIVNIRNDVKGALENSSKQPILETPNVNNDIEKTQIIQAVKDTATDLVTDDNEVIEGQETIIIDEPIKAEDVNLEREAQEAKAELESKELEKEEADNKKEEMPEEASLNIVIAVEEPAEQEKNQEKVEQETETENKEIDENDEEDDDDVTFDDLLKAAEEEERQQQEQAEKDNNNNLEENTENNKEETKIKEKEVKEESKKETKKEDNKKEKELNKKDVEKTKSKVKKPAKRAKKTISRKK